jgi:hypothetical protein
MAGQELLCLFCFRSFLQQNLCFRCMTPTCAGRALDEVYAKVRGYGTTMMGRVLVPGSRRSVFGPPNDVICDICKTVSYTRICPHCHFELPHDIGQIDQRIIALIGARATGKTHYLASLITSLQHHIGKNFHFTVRMIGDETQERWERDFYTPLFVNKTVLFPNRPAEVDPVVKSPLIFRCTFNGHHRRALNLIFFDSAGEDLLSLTTMSLQYRYITRADGIIFLLDPLQIPRVRSQIASLNTLPPANMKASPEYIVSRLRDLFERERKLRASQPVRTPIAFTLSKVDRLFPMLEPGSEFHHPGTHNVYLDLDDIQSVHTEISNYLATWISPNFETMIDSSFARYNYFGVSSLGEQPDESNHLEAVTPLRVEDPFLWLLYQLGYIKGKKRR